MNINIMAVLSYIVNYIVSMLGSPAVVAGCTMLATQIAEHFMKHTNKFKPNGAIEGYVMLFHSVFHVCDDISEKVLADMQTSQQPIVPVAKVPDASTETKVP